MKTALTIVATAALAATASAQAGFSSPSEDRGYQACVSAVKNDYRNFIAKRDYYIREADGTRTFYINATALERGERVPVGITCATSTSGRKVLSTDTTFALFVPATGADIAAN